MRLRRHARPLPTLTAVAATAAIAAACSAPPAPPPPNPAPSQTTPSASAPGPASPPTPNIPIDQRDNAFVAALQRNQLNPGSPQEAGDLGHAICQELDTNTPVDQLVTDVQTGAKTSLQDTGYVIGAATGVYCPNNLSKLPKN